MPWLEGSVAQSISSSRWRLLSFWKSARKALSSDAVKKISDVVRRKKSEKIVLEEWRVAGLVGDPQVRKYFESVKPLVEEDQGEKLS